MRQNHEKAIKYIVESVHIVIIIYELNSNKVFLIIIIEPILCENHINVVCKLILYYWRENISLNNGRTGVF